MESELCEQFELYDDESKVPRVNVLENTNTDVKKCPLTVPKMKEVEPLLAASPSLPTPNTFHIHESSWQRTPSESFENEFSSFEP